MRVPLPDDRIAASADPLGGRGRSEGEIVEAIRALEDLKARACAAQARLAADLDAAVRERHADLGLPAAEHGRGVAGQVAAARREAPARGARLLGLAKALTDELPHTLAAMQAGVLSEWRATLIARETACLARADRRIVDARLCGPDVGRYRFEGWGDRRLVAQAQQLVYAVDPHAVVDRRARAEAARHVSLRPVPDTMSQLTALLPAAQGVAVWATLSRAADAAVAAGDTRARGQVMADTLVERLTGQHAAAAVPIAVNLVVSDQTLLGHGAEPAWLAGYGPLGPDAVRGLTRRALADSAATLRRLYATPEAGRLVAMDTTARIFPKNLAHFLDLRDRTCRTPWCDAPIRHHDHVTDWASGGSTSAANGQGLCEACNHAKQAPGWRTRPLTGPPGAAEAPHTVEITLPTGHRLRSSAPAAPIPAPLADRPRLRMEHYYSPVHLEVA